MPIVSCKVFFLFLYFFVNEFAANVIEATKKYNTRLTK